MIVSSHLASVFVVLLVCCFFTYFCFWLFFVSVSLSLFMYSFFAATANKVDFSSVSEAVKCKQHRFFQRYLMSTNSLCVLCCDKATAVI